MPPRTPTKRAADENERRRQHEAVMNGPTCGSAGMISIAASPQRIASVNPHKAAEPAPIGAYPFTQQRKEREHELAECKNDQQKLPAIRPIVSGTRSLRPEYCADQMTIYCMAWR